MIGVNFQPGSGSGGGSGQRRDGNQAGVQEAIKVLSLRLPKVVGAQGIASAPLLQSAGSDGNRVDSVVNSILGRMFPTGQGEPPSNVPSFGTAPAQMGESSGYGTAAPNYSVPNFGEYGRQAARPNVTQINPWSTVPRIISGGNGQNPTGPIGVGDFTTTPGGPSSQNPAGVFESLPPGLFGGSPYGDSGSQPPASIASGPSWPTYQPPPDQYGAPAV